MEVNCPTCRSCGNLLKSEESCTFCGPVKKMLVWPATRDEIDTHATAKQLTQDTAKMLRRQLRRLKKVEQDQAGYDSSITKEMVTLSRVIKELSGEVRKLEDRDSERYEALTYEEKVRLLRDEFFAQLPEEQQQALLTSFQAVFETQRISLLPPSDAEIIEE